LVGGQRRWRAAIELQTEALKHGGWRMTIFEGSNGSIEVRGREIIIRRKGFANVLTQGFQGEKTIPFANITAVQFKEAGRWMAGMIQFTVLGGRDFRGGLMEATKDENAVLFDYDQQVEFAVLRDYVRENIVSQNTSATSDADDLLKLAELVEKGFLTREEFENRKAIILNR
jgi:hypothetical protein